jgi:hypothetical protein
MKQDLFKMGNVVYFKEAAKGVAKSALRAKAQGHFFGILLGYVPPFQKEPPVSHMLRIMGEAGFLSFDDVGEILGDKVAAEVVRKFELKYYGRTSEANAFEKLPLKTRIKQWWKRKPEKPEHEELPEAAKEEKRHSDLVDSRSRLIDTNGRPL